MSDNNTSGNNVLVVSFPEGEDSNAYEAITRLKELDAQGQCSLEAAAVVARSENGEITEKDEVGDEFLAGTAGGGLIGLVVGIIGGPLGVLIGGATRAPRRIAVRSRRRG